MNPLLRSALVNTDSHALRQLAADEDCLLAALGPQERLLAIGIDATGHAGTSAVTADRVLQLRDGDVVSCAQPRSDLIIRADDSYLVTLQHLRSPTFFSRTEALRFWRAVARCDIPVLFPDFYLRLLRATGKPETAENVVELISRTRDVFLTRFPAELDEDADLLAVPDRIINLRWQSHPDDRDRLRAMVSRVHEHFVAPTSFVWERGDDLTEPPDDVA